MSSINAQYLEYSQLQQTILLIITHSNGHLKEVKLIILIKQSKIQGAFIFFSLYSTKAE